MFTYVHSPVDPLATHACNCVGPQNGDPVCPCAMKGYTKQKMAAMALDLLTKLGKPRYRVKAGRRVAT